MKRCMEREGGRDWGREGRFGGGGVGIGSFQKEWFWKERERGSTVCEGRGRKGGKVSGKKGGGAGGGRFVW
jgi:hypothetical protein